MIMAMAKSLDKDKNEICRPERSEGALQWLRDSSVATNTLPQSDTNWALLQLGVCDDCHWTKHVNLGIVVWSSLRQICFEAFAGK